jgi:hypothetical protein
MKGENSDTNGSKPTFDILMEEGRKAFEAYHANFEELFLSRYEVT